MSLVFSGLVWVEPGRLGSWQSVLGWTGRFSGQESGPTHTNTHTLMEYVNEEEISCLGETRAQPRLATLSGRVLLLIAPSFSFSITLYPGPSFSCFLCLLNRPNQIPLFLLVLFILVSTGKIDLTQGHWGDVIFFPLTFSISNHIILIIWSRGLTS